MINNRYNQQELDRLYDYALGNPSGSDGKSLGIGSLFYEAAAAGYTRSDQTQALTRLPGHSTSPFSILDGFPGYAKDGMNQKPFVGPQLGKARLFPKAAISLFVALGSVGKTSTLIGMASHMACGRAWGTNSLSRTKGIIFSVEETRDELWRKFGATVADWNENEIRAAQKNLLLYSLSERDPRLTITEGRNTKPSPLGDQIISIAKDFEAEFLIFDHLQGMVAGDLNNSDTMVTFAHECNRIATLTNAAVIIAAHTNKSNIGADSVSHGFATGSLSIENAARQVTGLIPLPSSDAKTYGLEQVKSNYIRIEMPKNSYGPGGEHGFLCKHYVEKFHTVSILPFEPAAVATSPLMTKSERLQRDLVEHIRSNTGATKASLDAEAGKSGVFKATRKEIRGALYELGESGQIKIINVTRADRARLGLKPQIKQIYSLGGES